MIRVAAILLALAAPAAAQTADKLENVTWRVAEGPGASAGERGAPYLSFSAGGRVSGFGGCNLIGGKLQIRDSEIEMTMAALTRRRCAPAMAEVEAALLEALNAAATYELTPGRLSLSDMEGGGLVLADRARPAPAVGRIGAAPPTTDAAPGQ